MILLKRHCANHILFFQAELSVGFIFHNQYIEIETEQKTQEYKLMAILEKAELLPPLLVLDILFSSPVATLGTVRDYILRVLADQGRSMTADEAKIKQYREDTAKINKQLLEIQET